jgi:hypothetical protein
MLQKAFRFLFKPTGEANSCCCDVSRFNDKKHSCSSAMSRLYGKAQTLNLQECRRNMRVYACRHIVAVCCNELEYARFASYVVCDYNEAKDETHVTISCGLDDHAQSIDDWKSVGLGHCLDKHPNLATLPTLECGHEAEFLDGVWIIAPHAEG